METDLSQKVPNSSNSEARNLFQSVSLPEFLTGNYSKLARPLKALILAYTL